MTLDDLLKEAQKPRRVVPFKAGGLSGFVRSLNAGDCEQAAAIASKLELPNDRRVLLAMAVCEEDGTPLCPDPEKHLETLKGLREFTVREIMAKVNEASSVDTQALVGNSEGRTDGSATASPSP